MYFSVIEAVPEPDSDAAQKYEGGHVACWINSADWKSAQERATALVLNSGWIVRKIVEEKEVSAESYEADEPGLEHFEQALIDDEVCVFYTFPKS
jgi:hypothetical protein